MAKPRTNYDAIAYWADSILEREPRAGIEVNSIIVANDVVFSFGRHWPMGVIERGPQGRAKRVYLNSDHCASMGFANTNGDQNTVWALARQAASERGIETVQRPMGTGWRVSGDGTVPCRPKSSDPEPPSVWRCEIPTVFHAADPGPEPVDDGVGCIAGRREEYSYEISEYVGSPAHSYGRDLDLNLQDQGYALPVAGLVRAYDAPLPGDATFWHYYSDGKALHAQRAGNGVITWREPKPWEYQQVRSADSEDKLCPHCVAFMRRHAAWDVAYHGPRWGRNRGKGWALYSEMIERFGSTEEWREQRLIEFRRVREGRKTYAAWRERNYMPVSALPAQGSGPLSYVPRLDTDGRPFRKDSEAYFRAQRAAERAERRRQREHEAQERHRRQVERFARGIRRRRKPTFVTIAADLATTLDAYNKKLDERAPTNERES